MVHTGRGVYPEGGASSEVHQSGLHPSWLYLGRGGASVWTAS